MTLPGNGTTKKVIAGVVTAIVIGIATQVFVNTNRLTTLEAQIVSLKEGLATNRIENRDEHQNIVNKLDRIQMEIIKK
jgi:uncharacterized membrane protein (DUF106 family)